MKQRPARYALCQCDRLPEPHQKGDHLLAACDRICGVDASYHKDRCPLYKANCEAMRASRRLGPR